MLKPAIQYQEQLTKLLSSLWFEEKYKFYKGMVEKSFSFFALLFKNYILTYGNIDINI